MDDRNKLSELKEKIREWEDDEVFEGDLNYQRMLERKEDLEEELNDEEE